MSRSQCRILMGLIVLLCAISPFNSQATASSVTNRAYRNSDVPVISQEAPKQSARMFDEVPVNSWIYRAVAGLQEKKLLLGYPKSYFDGRRTVTRCEFAVAMNRTLSAFVPFVRQPNVGYSGPDQMDHGGFSVSAQDLRLIRILALELKTELIALGTNWVQNDDNLRRLQDIRLHRDLQEALAATPQIDSLRKIDTRPVKRPDPIYVSLDYLAAHKIIKPISATMQLSRPDIAAFVRESFPMLPSRETGYASDRGDYGSDGTRDYGLPDPLRDMRALIELHRLVRTLRYELAVQGVDFKAVELRLTWAENLQITAELKIDLESPEAALRPAT